MAPFSLESIMECHIDHEVTGLHLDEWMAMVKLEYHDTVRFVLETGENETYGELGSVTAATGPDMQADVVGVWSHEYAFMTYVRTITVTDGKAYATIDLSVK